MQILGLQAAQFQTSTDCCLVENDFRYNCLVLCWWSGKQKSVLKLLTVRRNECQTPVTENIFLQTVQHVSLLAKTLYTMFHIVYYALDHV